MRSTAKGASNSSSGHSFRLINKLHPVRQHQSSGTTVTIGTGQPKQQPAKADPQGTARNAKNRANPQGCTARSAKKRANPPEAPPNPKMPER
jgi:hypothetical protein